MSSLQDMERARAIQHAIYGAEPEVLIGWWVVPAACILLVALVAVAAALPVLWLAERLAGVTTRLARRTGRV